MKTTIALLALFLAATAALAYDPIVYPTNAPAGVVVAPTDAGPEFADLLARTVATNTAPASVELLRAFVADLYATVGTMPGAEGWDEALDAIVSTAYSNLVTHAEAAAAINAALAGLTPAAVGALPAAGYPAVAAPTDAGPDPYGAVSFTASARALRVTGEGTNYVSAVYAPNGVECHYLVGGFDAVRWPTGAVEFVGADLYDPAKENAYLVRSVNGTPVLQWLFAK